MAKAPKKAKKKSQKKISNDATAPQKRGVLFTPWRASYIKGTHSETRAPGCVFCTAFEKGKTLETLVVYKGKTASVILNKFPYNNGHTMVVPHRHTADFSSLNSEEFTELHDLLRKTHDALISAYLPQGMNIGLNLGRVGGAGIVDHMHYHLVPRWGGDTNFMPIIGHTKVVSETLEETYKKLLPLFL